MDQIKLSATSLKVFRECPRCFWMEKVKKAGRPRGIFPSITNGIDRVAKEYFDAWRGKQELPPILRQIPPDCVDGLYPDQPMLDKWRDWRSGAFEFQDADGSVLTGAMDDGLVCGPEFVTFDVKSKGAEATQEYAEKYTTDQMNIYTLIIRQMGIQVADYGYLLYLSPRNMDSISPGVEGVQDIFFKAQLIRIQTNFDHAYQLFREAINCLNGPLPLQAKDCEYCSFITKRNAEFEKLKGKGK